MDNHTEYESPELKVLGTVGELTLGSYDKIGSATDQYTNCVQDITLDGSLVPDAPR